MRGLRSTIALLVVLIGLSAYIYFVTWNQPEGTEENRERVFAALEGDTIDNLSAEALTINADAIAYAVYLFASNGEVLND